MMWEVTTCYEPVDIDFRILYIKHSNSIFENEWIIKVSQKFHWGNLTRENHLDYGAKSGPEVLFI